MQMKLSCIFLVLISTSLSSCLVHSRCVSDSDCTGNEQCGDDGECALECTAEVADACPAERPQCLVESNRCVECLEAEQCGDDERCSNWVCVSAMTNDFTLFDLNPTSPTFEQEVSLSDYLGQVVVIFFAGLS